MDEASGTTVPLERSSARCAHWPHFFHDAGKLQTIDNGYSHVLNDSRGSHLRVHAGGLVQQGGQHNEYYWRQRIPGALEFLLGSR